MSTRPTRLQLFLDFDGTITRKDTLHIVAKAGYDRQQKLSRSPTPWQEIVDAYLTDYSAHEKDFTPRRSDRKSMDDEIKWLNSLKSIEEASAQRILDAGVFDGLRMSDMQGVADEGLSTGEIEIRPGCFNMISSVFRLNGDIKTQKFRAHKYIQILSVNWSRCFISRVYNLAAGKSVGEISQEDLHHILAQTSFSANEVTSIVENSKQDGSRDDSDDHVCLRTSGDKVKRLEECRIQENDDVDLCSIYIGDSTTDLECLLRVNVGICVRDEPMGGSQRELAATCDRLGIPVNHISLRRSLSQNNLGAEIKNSKIQLWWVRDFREVDAWLTKLKDES